MWCSRNPITNLKVSVGVEYLHKPTATLPVLLPPLLINFTPTPNHCFDIPNCQAQH